MQRVTSTPKSSLQAALLLATCVAALGMPAWYTCDPATCLAPDCVCAATAPPGGLAPEDTPQFIVITHDDAITADTNKGIRAIIDQHTNRNGCNVPATFYVLTLGTQCELTKLFWEQNSEISIHSSTHVPLTPPLLDNPKKLAAEMFGARTFLNETCGIPLEDMVGFRAPLLVHSPKQREALVQAGMLYDTSIPEFWGPNSEISPNGSVRLWPYTMDSSIPQNCAYFAGTVCNQNESYPGLWEFPVLNTQAENGSLLYSMDPGRDTQDGGYAAQDVLGLPAAELEALLKANFDYSYNGNRAPFGIYVHTPWFTEGNIQAANNFLKYALELNNTWVVTVRQVLEWMQDPVPAGEMDDWLTCNPVDLTNVPGMQKCLVYSVVVGDSGAAVAERFGVDLVDLAALNPKLESLQAGQLLKIPPFDASCGAGTPSTGPNLAAPPANTAAPMTPAAPAPAARRLLRASEPL